MKKYLLLISGLILILDIAACQKQPQQPDEPALSKIEELKKQPAAPQELTFEGDEDSQSYWNVFSHEAASGENGYYYMAQEEIAGHVTAYLLGFMDPGTGECVPVCKIPGCTHSDRDCPAIFEDYFCGVWYYDKHLYFIRGRGGSAVLVRTEPDGSGRKELFEIGSEATARSMTYNLVFCNNNVYIYDRTGNHTHGQDTAINIRKRSLDGREDAEIITGNEADSVFDALKAYGGNVFFVYTHSPFDSVTRKNTTTGEGLFCYNDGTGRLIKVIDKSISDYTIDQENRIIYYYVINEGLYKYDLKSGSDEMIYKAERNTMLCQVSFDGEYICLDNGRWVAFTRDADLYNRIWVLDRTGNVLNVIDSDDDYYASYFGDGRCILKESKDGNVVAFSNYEYLRDAIHFKYIPKSDIETAAEWKQAYWSDIGRPEERERPKTGE